MHRALLFDGGCGLCAASYRWVAAQRHALFGGRPDFALDPEKGTS